VSIKVDSVIESVWKKVNRPHGSMGLEGILEGLNELSDRFKGSLITETMLMKGINDVAESVKETADFIREIDPRIAYLTVPIRPPSENWVEIPPDDTILKVIGEFTSRKIRTIPLTDREYGDFTYTGDVKSDILAITSVHPMREDSMKEMLHRSGDEWDVVEELVGSGKLLVTGYQGINFYRRKFERR
jgi:wyosine [tRNA(Phe)-imidazoG37] synthetase (radical SAM superfamily)